MELRCLHSPASPSVPDQRHLNHPDLLQYVRDDIRGPQVRLQPVLDAPVEAIWGVLPLELPAVVRQDPARRSVELRDGGLDEVARDPDPAVAERQAPEGLGHKGAHPVQNLVVNRRSLQAWSRRLGGHHGTNRIRAFPPVLHRHCLNVAS